MDETSVARARTEGILCPRADALNEQASQAAGATRARLLATVLSNHTANVFITQFAPGLAPGLEIAGRGDLPGTERTLPRAGVNKVVPRSIWAGNGSLK